MEIIERLKIIRILNNKFSIDDGAHNIMNDKKYLTRK